MDWADGRKRNRIHPVASAGSSEGILDIYNINKCVNVNPVVKRLKLLKPINFISATII